MSMKEIWKDVIGYEGLYQVSNLGRVKSLDRFCIDGRKRYGQIMKQVITNGGYFAVGLRKGKGQKRYLVHRLVAEAFIPNTDNKPCVDHINTIRTDNRVCNLRWCTYKENCNNSKKSFKSFTSIYFSPFRINISYRSRWLQSNKKESSCS